MNNVFDATSHLFAAGHALLQRATGGDKSSAPVPTKAPRTKLHASGSATAVRGVPAAAKRRAVEGGAGSASFGAGESGAARSAFARWSENLYCSGAMEQNCRLADGREAVKAGQCYWHKQQMRKWQPVTETDLDTAKRPTFAGHRWDPLDPPSGGSGFRYFGRDEASRCLQGKRVLVAGDSTTRDTFYELVTVAGHGGLIMRNLPNESAAYWPDGAYSPREPGGTMQDRNGWCMGNHEKRHSCLRDLHIADPRGGAATRFSYQFLTQSNSTWELGLSGRQLGDRAPDFAFVQCPQYEYFKPDAYDYTLSKEERAKPSNRMMGPEHLAGIGRSCRDFIERAVVSQGRGDKGRRTRIFHLGMTPLPGWTRDIGGERVEADIFHSLHAGLGLRCRKQADGTYAHTVHHASPVAASIDRYAIVGQRKRDGIHPFWNAQFAIAQLMLNHMCPQLP